MVVEVLTESKAKNLDQTFSYLVPPCLESLIQVGMRVRVPFGRQSLEGFIVGIAPDQNYDYPLKEIEQLVDEKRVLTDDLLELGAYMSKKTLSKRIFCYQTMLPSALKAKKGYTVPKKYETYLVLTSNRLPVSELQQQIISLIEKEGKILKKEAIGISRSAVNTLIKNGLVMEQIEEVYRLGSSTTEVEKPRILSSLQLEVYEEVMAHMNSFYPCLLHGVTGSGKTEVYMQWIYEVRRMGKDAIVLVPEISLTPQMVENFKKRFGSDIAILHSRLSQGEKYDEWRKIENGEVHIVIGARSAVFAPLPNLGIIIIDEEHSATYKQENTPKYHAIDMALMRAQSKKIPIILGSATPSIESYTRAKTGVYHLLELKERVLSSLPQVTCIDMKEQIKKGNAIVSEVLDQAIKERLEKQEQVILLLNRRGYQTVIHCDHCGYVHECPNCDIPLTYHKSTHKMSCHYCGYQTPLLSVCPSCHAREMSGRGLGTEKLVELLTDRYPSARILRMDVDTTTKKGSHEWMIQSFQNHEYDILVGTQMIAKGLDFKDVTLVGVLNGDATLNLPDFRSAERTFQLLNQVAGRAGRHQKKGDVLIQAFHIDHYSIVCASHHDYDTFYKEEMSIRKKLGYPPYQNLALFKISGKNEQQVEIEMKKVAQYLRKHCHEDQTILGPNACSMPKMNQIYSMQVMVKHKKTKPLLESCYFLLEHYRNVKTVNLDIDLAPIRV